MDAQPAAAELKHHYQTNLWTRLPAEPAISKTTSIYAPESVIAYFPSHLELLPILLPQHLSISQDKLQYYNRLVSSSRGGGSCLDTLQSPTAISLTQSQPVARSKSSSKVSTKDGLSGKLSVLSCHGNRTVKHTENAERVPITSAKEMSVKMSGKKQPDQNGLHGLPARPPLPTDQMNHLPATVTSSVPSTPHQHARKFSFESRDPSPGATQNHSPRSAYSETNGNVPSLRPLPPRLGGCRFETAIPFSRRRMPYSIGADRLDPVDPDKIKSRLAEDHEAKLTTTLRELYDSLIPTPEVERKRKKLVQKLEKILNDEWPGHDIQVNLFGSSGNLLCSDDSDVDICITTPWKELESVCMIAELLHKHGMEKVVCVSSAKVPIVKIWDPELQLACDMNVNNTLALENTRMVRTYVEIDERVRPLAMIIKYWTRRRIINDAAFGGTLSSYTWICLTIAFLQLRDPPVLPALHQENSLKLLRPDGTKSDFADDIDKLRGFGDKNKDSLAALLFNFFRFYAHEFDYDKYALSIRTGKLLSKVEKRWHIGVNNMLCVEEPFNTMRNLGNTADDTSFRGLHMELRRAFELIADGKFEECCEQYVFPKEEERTIFQKPASTSRPILVRSSSQTHSSRNPRNGGFRNARQYNRNGNAGRRGSSSVTHDPNSTYVPAGIPGQMASPEFLQWYHQHGIPPEVYASQLNALSQQQQQHQQQQDSIRYQLFAHSQQINQQQLLAHANRTRAGGSQNTDRSRTNSFDNLPTSPPVRPEQLLYGYAFPLQNPAYFHPALQTYPSSPVTAAATAGGGPEYRRSLHRNAAASESGASTGSGTLRSQSQPASRTPTASTQNMTGYLGTSQPSVGIPIPFPRMAMPHYVPDEAIDSDIDLASANSVTDSPPEEDGSRYNHFFMHGGSSPVANGTHGIIPSLGELTLDNETRHRLSSDQLPQSVLDRRMKRTSRSPSPLGHSRTPSVGNSSAPSAPVSQTNGKLAPSRGPLVVNGSMGKTKPASSVSRQPLPVAEPPVPEDATYENPVYIHQGFYNGGWTEPTNFHLPTVTGHNPAQFPDRPVIVNSTTATRSPASSKNMGDASFQQRIAMANSFHPGIPYAPLTSDTTSSPGLSPPNGDRMRSIARQQNGIAPLDLAAGSFGVSQDLQHLSPVYEARTPSPTLMRKYESSLGVSTPTLESTNGSRSERSDTWRSGQKTSPVKSPPAGPAAKLDSVTRSPVLDQRSNGTSRGNGHLRNGNKGQSEGLSDWQKSKPRKKGMADLKHAASTFAQSEQVPKNDGDRRGG
ncbi:hypothetical protein GE21DRAFT_2198 [Neurospora crassa]|uniref:polynucleotide adenylyltransferase n=1 Tax=Neurospora crassa (strain ATCC 24698 / 74-OR23-1A / CBS 708.71 / DSM 1257 / FGSC 987) TaxID=367110 RepID=Q7SDK6_NEUCR|nr:PAP/25A associated domain family protein [Neurospora crassa OR74A]EAA34854.3 PAP/25A associated domain family protein [Neurospora crassa OR74A]KHE85120.1 hypothetical protein GE21DRAFT_2198 [Neurospora crassa]|eukprot:XP_964090.3 PAP/25A associated domain family protein [Neurospora crassa OR74A]